MDQKIFFIFLIVFLLTSEFYLMIRNIIIYGIYLFVIMYILKIINPNISDNIKSFLNIVINTDEKYIMNTISNTIKYIKSIFNINKLSNLFEEEIKKLSD